MSAIEEVEVRPALSHEEYLRALKLRVEVFVEEQGGPLEDEPDCWDPAARHFVALRDGEIVGTARFYQPCLGVGKIGRVAVRREARGQGLGRQLLETMIGHARSLGLREIRLDSQVSVIGFYERLGLQSEGGPFMEAGILHQSMRLTLRGDHVEPGSPDTSGSSRTGSDGGPRSSLSDRARPSSSVPGSLQR